MLHDPAPRPSTGRLVLCVLAGVTLGVVLGINFQDLFIAAFTVFLGAVVALGERK